MQLSRDYYRNLETPDFVLCKANREKIGVIPCTEKMIDFNFGDMDEISFKTYYMIDGQLNPVYADIEVMKYVLVPNTGFFYIKTCTVESEGTEHEYKDIRGQSIEGLLGQKYIENFLINTGETGSKELEYDSSGNTHIHIYLSPSQKVTGKLDLFDYVLEKCPDWYVAYCDPVLLDDSRSHRSFKVDRQDVYSFIMNDIQDTFECYVLFDTIHLDNKGRCPISIYAQESFKNDTDIYVSYDNLLKSTNISADTDDIKTCVVLKGQDDLEIREMNFGYDRLYNFEYYNNTDFWSQKLYDEYNAWLTKTYTVGAIVRSPNVYTEDISDADLANMSYLDLYKYRIKKYLEAKAEFDELNNHTSAFVNDEQRSIGSGRFPVFNNDGEEVGSIEFETDTGVRLTENLPSSPYSNETNYIYIVKDATVNISTLKTQLSYLEQGKTYQTIQNAPIPEVKTATVYQLQNKFFEASTNARKNIYLRLRELENGGSVDLVTRPVINNKLLQDAGWGKMPEGVATVFTATYSDRTNRIVMNLTPIKAEGDTLVRVLTPNELESYANNLIRQYEMNHKCNDYQQLKIGDVFRSISSAEAVAEEIHQLHETYYMTGAYWDYMDTSSQTSEKVRVLNVNALNQAINEEKRIVEQYLMLHRGYYDYNYREKSEKEKLDYQKYNDAKNRQRFLNKIINKLIEWKPTAPTYAVQNTVANRLINLNSAYSRILTAGYSSSQYKINNLTQYQNQINSDINTKKNQIEVATSQSTVTYPGYKIYRWFDNSKMLQFYNALASANSSYESSGNISVANATTMRDFNPLYNNCLIINSTFVTITDVEAFEEYLEADFKEQSALKAKFPSSAWFNTNDWQGYGYSELHDTWALSIDQILAVLSKDNKGVVPNDYKDEEVDEADFACAATSKKDQDSPWYYFAEYLPAYLTQLAIEEKVSSLEKQMFGYDTYPYAINSKGSSYYENLPTTGNTKGDTYTVTNNFIISGITYPKGTNVTWNGSKWVVTDSLMTHIDGIQDNIDNQSKYKAQVVNEIAMDNNLSESSKIELSSFIREEELTSDNFVVTDVMSEEERQEMIQSFIDYGDKELSKICIPQLTFTANIADLFTIPEFDAVSYDFEPGNSIYVALRDDYHVKAMLLNLHVNYEDPDDFTIKFSDVFKKAKGLYSDLQEAINGATSAATSVAIGSSEWTAGAEMATRITTTLEEGLLSQGAYLRDNPAKSTFTISDIGLFVDTASGEHGKYDVFQEEKFVYDSIYIGGGRILFTDDGWKHVRMSLGRSKVKRITASGAITNAEEFGVFADFCIAGYIGGSQICGGELYSAAFTNNNRYPKTYFNLDAGTFTLRDDAGNSLLDFRNGGLVISNYTTKGEFDNYKQSVSDTYETKQHANDEFAARTTTEALKNFFNGTNYQNFTGINGGVINTGFIHSNNNKSWIDLSNGNFNFGGGNGTGTSDSSSVNYMQWLNGKLVIKGDIYANNGTFNGTVYASNGSFSGSITSSNATLNAGKIAGWTFTGTTLTSSNNQLVLNSTGKIKFGITSLYSGTGTGRLFIDTSVDIGGNLYCDTLYSTGLSVNSDYVAEGYYRHALRLTQTQNEDYYVYVGTYGFNPNTNGDLNCGGGDHRWKQVYATSGSINTSDRNEKHDIRPIENNFEKLFFKLKPVNYMYNNGDRTHIGIIAQDLEESLDELGMTSMDLSAFCKDIKQTTTVDMHGNLIDVPKLDSNGNKSYTYGIRYSEFIMLNTHMIQKLYQRVDELEQEIERLKNA